MTTLITPLQKYQSSIDNGQVSFDEDQQQALLALQNLYERQLDEQPLHEKTSDLGLYLWGKVGRGKTFLMDSFAESFDESTCKRQHFHHFMRDVHKQLAQLSGCEDPLKEIAKQLSSQHKILCFDEFFVNDIGDAMLLGRLFIFLFEQRMIIVATSNSSPDELYKDGLQRANFLPAIDAIYKNMQVVELAGTKDHRERKLHSLQNYFLITDGFQEPTFFPSKKLDKKSDKKTGILEILGREINYLAVDASNSQNKSIVFDFEDLCLGPRSHFDYIEIAKQFDTVYLLNVPALGGAMYERIKARGTEDGSVGSGDTGERQVKLAPMDDGARRFIALVDELYDQQVAFYLTCHVSLEELYTQGSLAFQFERARSRLIEMGSEEYIARSRGI